MFVFRALLACFLSFCVSFRLGSFPGSFRSGSRLIFRGPKVGAARLPQVGARAARQHSWLRAANNEFKRKDIHLLSEMSLLDSWTAKKAEQLEEAPGLKEVFKLYTQFLLETCNGPVDPVSLVAYQATIRRVVYQVIKFRPEGSSEADLMDSVTDAHLNAIDKLLGSHFDPSETGGFYSSFDDNPDESSNDRYCTYLAAVLAPSDPILVVFFFEI